MFTRENIKKVNDLWFKYGCSSLWNQFLNNENIGVSGLFRMLEVSVENPLELEIYNNLLKAVDKDLNCTPCQIKRMRGWPVSKKYQKFITKSLNKYVEKTFAMAEDKIYNESEIYDLLFKQ